MKKLLFALTIYFISINSLYALIEVDITRGNLDPLPIAVSPLHVDIKSVEYEDIKVKELIVDPGKGMSFQKHFKRSEIWLVSKGSCEVNYSIEDPNDRKNLQLNKFDHYSVPVGQWHQITNPFDKSCHLIEIQYGEALIEEDIERADYYDPK